MKRAVYIIALIALLWTSRAEAVTWHVNKSGSDGNSCNTAQSATPASAKLTIRAGIQCAKDNGAPGNTVEIAAGSYNERFESGFLPSGSSGNPFTITNKSGDSVEIKPLSASGSFTPIISFEGSGLQYVNLIGTSGFLFKIDGTNQTNGATPIIIGGNGNNTIQGIEFLNNNGTNAILVQSTNNSIIRNKIHDGSFLVNGGGDYGYPIYIEGNSNTVDGNELYTFPRYGIHVNHSGSSVANVIVRNNIIHGGTYAVDSDAAIVCSTECTTGNQIYNNLIYNQTNGHGIKISGTGTAVYNNTVFQSPQKGIYVYPTNSNNINVKNNIVYQSTTGDMLDQGSGTTWSNNWCGSISTECQFGGNPLFTNSGSSDFTLQTTSSAINAGTTNIAPGITVPACSGGVVLNCYNGTAPDLGAFETGVPTAGGGPPTLTPNLTNVAAGQIIKVTVDDDDVNERTENTGDYVGMYIPGATSTGFVDWFYMNNTKTAPATAISDAVLTFTAPATQGTYEFRFYQNGSTLEADRLATATFTVVPAGIVMKLNVSSLKIGPSVTWKVGTP